MFDCLEIDRKGGWSAVDGSGPPQRDTGAPAAARFEEGSSDVGGTAATAQAIGVGDVVAAAINPKTDEDMFSFEVVAGRRYTISVDLLTLDDSELYLYDANGVEFAYNDDAGTTYGSGISFDAEQTATIYAKVTSWGGETTGTYELTLSDDGPAAVDDHGNDITNASAATVGVVATGTIGTSVDRDVFSFSVTTGNRYVIDLDPTASSTNQLYDGVLRLFDADGTELSFNDAADLEGGDYSARIAFTASTSGTLFAEASGFSDVTGDYDLLITDFGAAPADDHGDTHASATSITMGSSNSGTIGEEIDLDFFAFDVARGQSYTITLHPDTDSSLALSQGAIRLYNSTGAAIALDKTPSTASGALAELTFHADAEGSYYFSVDGDSANVGGYNTSVIDNGSASPLEALDSGFYTKQPNINVYFVDGGASVTNNYGETFDTTAWGSNEISASTSAFDAFEAVIDVQYTVVSDPAQADFMMLSSVNAFEGPGILGYWSNGGYVELGGVTYWLDGYGVFNENGYGWDADGLQQGGLGYETILHEVGHGMGLAHAHDASGSSTAMAGVSVPFDDLGLYDLNQTVFTVMSYNRGWATGPQGRTPSDDYGTAGTLMALDIATLQNVYGANAATAAGNDVYVLPSTNGPGTFYASIWDTGGVDTISAAGVATGAVIDLRSADPSTYNEGAGGRVSFVSGTHGGFTIAANVLIENATGGEGADKIIGNDAANVIDGRGGVDNISGGLGSDRIFGRDGNDTLQGGGGRDFLRGNNGADELYGGSDDDRLYGDAGSDIIFGDDGSDQLYGGTDNDQLFGGSGADYMVGQGGNDVLEGELGNDYIRGSSGLDTINGGDGADRIFGDGENDTLRGNSGDDQIFGGSDDDVLNGDDGNDLLRGGSGADTFYGGVGDDRLFGDADDDFLEGNQGNDQLNGGAGNDELDGGDGADFLNGQSGTDVLRGGVGDDFVRGGLDTDQLYGGIGNDRLYGDDGNDTVYGDAGSDQVEGGAGNDSLYGGIGADRMYGGNGLDTLYGGPGVDRLDGGLGSDNFVYRDGDFDGGLTNNADIIKDFELGLDVVDLSAMDADLGTAGDQAFAFVGSAAFSGTAGELRVDGERIFGDFDGDGVADFRITTSGVTDIDQTDFVL